MTGAKSPEASSLQRKRLLASRIAPLKPKIARPAMPLVPQLRHLRRHARVAEPWLLNRVEGLRFRQYGSGFYDLGLKVQDPSLLGPFASHPFSVGKVASHLKCRQTAQNPHG